MRHKLLNAVPGREVVRVLVVDDHALFAEALMLTLGIDDRIQVVGSASSGTEAVALAKALNPDVVLMDLHMPSMDGIEATDTCAGSLLNRGSSSSPPPALPSSPRTPGSQGQSAT